jgi:hypothetical protein
LRDAGDRHLDNLSRQERKERQAHCSVAPCVRGGSTVLLVEPLGRSRGGCLLLLTWFLSEPCLPDTCDRQACGSTEPPQALAPGTNERREPSSDATETRGSLMRVPRPGHGVPKTGVELKHGPSLRSSILQFHSIHCRAGNRDAEHAHALCCPNYTDAVVDRKSYGSTLRRE